MPQPLEPLFQPRRMLGRTGFRATQLGIGDLADRSVPIEQCVATARRAMDAGLNVIDTAPSYEDGYSEEIVGRAIRKIHGRGRRESLFVIDKIDHHDQPIGPQVDQSLTRLGMDHVDLIAFHGVSTLEGWSKLTAPGGGMDQLAAAVTVGKARFRGISSHHPGVLAAAIPSGLCDVVMFPIGPFVDLRYVEESLPLARKHGVGTVCFKTFGAGKLLADTTGYNRPLQQRPRGKISSGGEDALTRPDKSGHPLPPPDLGEGDGGEPLLPRLTVAECLHYTLTVDPDVALLGLSFPNEQDQAFAAYHSFKALGPGLSPGLSPGLNPGEMADIRRRAAAAVAGKGPCWWNPSP